MACSLSIRVSCLRVEEGGTSIILLLGATTWLGKTQGWHIMLLSGASAEMSIMDCRAGPTWVMSAAVLVLLIVELKNSPGLAQGVSDHWLFVLETTIEQRLLHFLFFFAIVVASLLNYSTTLWREGGLSGSIWPSPVSVVLLFGVLFFSLFSCTPFLSIKSHFSQNGHPNWPPNPLKTEPWTYFSKFSGNLVFERPYNVLAVL